MRRAGGGCHLCTGARKGINIMTALQFCKAVIFWQKERIRFRQCVLDFCQSMKYNKLECAYSDQKMEQNVENSEREQEM